MAIKSILNENQCLESILDSIHNSKSGSYIRKGDGENIMLGYKDLTNISFFKYRKKLIHFNIRLWDLSFQKFIKEELLSACCSATILGISGSEYKHGFWKIENKILSHFSITNPIYGDVNFHMGFIKIPYQKKLLNPLAEEIITKRKIGIIGHFNVEEFLANYSSQVVTKLEIPKRRAKFQNMNRNKYDAVLNKIYSINSKVDIWLVAAGIYAKSFCEYIRKAGGIGIDIGSSLDTWNDEYHSRGHLRQLYKKDNN